MAVPGTEASGNRCRRRRHGRRISVPLALALTLTLLSTVAALAAIPAAAAPAPTDAFTPAQTEELETTPPTDRMIVRFADSNAPAAASLEDEAGGPVDVVRQMGDGAWVVEVPRKLNGREAHELAERFEADAEVVQAEPDVILKPAILPNDPLYTNQWHYAAPTASKYGVNLPGAWDLTTGSADVVVAVIDTGKLEHPDLAGRFLSGYDFVSDVWTANDGNGRDADPTDPGDWIPLGAGTTSCPSMSSSWHGTHVAGTIGAVGNNGTGVAGVNWVSKLLPVRVLGKCGGSLSDVADAIRWAAGFSVSGVPDNPEANHADVINLSLAGGGPCSTSMGDAIDAAVGAGVTVVAAAGNYNTDAGFQPANCNNVLVVAATNKLGNRASYSNFGESVDIAAPGGEYSVDGGVLSTLNAGTTGPSTYTYGSYHGTSMAAPHVSGIVSLMLSRDPDLSPSETESILEGTVTPFPNSSTCNPFTCGAGIANAASAVEAVVPPPADGRYTPVEPHRLLDSRSGPGFTTPWGSGTTRDLTVVGGTTTVPADATAVVLNVTVTGPTATSYLTVWPDGKPRPLASNLNYTPGTTIANLVTVKVGATGKVSLYNNLGSVHVIADVVGYYRAGTGGDLSAVSPNRLLDSRVGTGGFVTPWGPGESRDLTVAGGATGVPEDATAVVLNVTVTAPTATSYLTAWPAGDATPPLASNLNYVAGQTVPNLAIVKVGAGGQISLYNNLGSVDVVADVVGYYREGGSSGLYAGRTPIRLLDSRLGIGGYSSPWGSVARDLKVAGAGTGVPAEATAVVLNVTVTSPTGNSFLTAWPAGETMPLASNLNFTPGLTIPNLVTVKVGAGGKISLYNDVGSAHVIADVVGYFD